MVQTITASSIGSTTAIGLPAVAPGNTVINPIGHPGTSAAGTPSVSTVANVAPLGAQNASEFGALSVSTEYHIDAQGTPSTTGVGIPALEAKEPAEQEISAIGIETTTNIGRPVFAIPTVIHIRGRVSDIKMTGNTKQLAITGKVSSTRVCKGEVAIIRLEGSIDDAV